MSRRSASRSSWDVTSGILHTNRQSASLHDRLTTGIHLELDYVPAHELLAGGAANSDPAVFRPLPAVLRVVLHHDPIEENVDIVAVRRLVVEGDLAADGDGGRNLAERLLQGSRIG